MLVIEIIKLNVLRGAYIFFIINNKMNIYIHMLFSFGSGIIFTGNVFKDKLANG